MNLFFAPVISSGSGPEQKTAGSSSYPLTFKIFPKLIFINFSSELRIHFCFCSGFFVFHPGLLPALLQTPNSFHPAGYGKKHLTRPTVLFPPPRESRETQQTGTEQPYRRRHRNRRVIRPAFGVDIGNYPLTIGAQQKSKAAKVVIMPSRPV